MSEEFENTPVTGGADRMEFLQRKAGRLESEAARWKREEAALRDMERRYLALLENPLFILMIISGGRVTFLNGRGEAFFGFPLRERPRFLFTDMVAPGFCAAVEDMLKKDGEADPWEKRCVFPVVPETGSEKWLEMTVTPADLGEDDTLIAVAREIPAPEADGETEPGGASGVPAEAENINAAVIGRDWKISSMTAGFIKEASLLWGNSPEAGEPILDLESPGDEGLPFRLAAERAFAGDRAEIGREAGDRYFILSFAPLFSSRGEITGVSLALLDRTAEKRAEQAARTAEEKFRRLFSRLSDAAVIVGAGDGRILDCNRAFLDRTGIGEDKARASGLDELGLLSPEDLKGILAQISGGRPSPAEISSSLTLPSGEALPAVILPLPFDGENAGSLLITMKETPKISPAPAAGAACAEKPVRPGIQGRENFLKTLSLEAESAERTRKPLSLILLEIDDFKELESALNEGERVRFQDDFCRLISERIQSGDYMAFLGGGEFAILTAAGGYIAHRAAEKVRSIVFHSKILPGANLSCSLGVSEFRREMTPEEFMKRASIALREAKRAGGNRAVLAPAVP